MFHFIYDRSFNYVVIYDAEEVLENKLAVIGLSNGVGIRQKK
jgi:hypothetical protein